MKIARESFEFRPLSEEHLDDILRIQDETIAALPSEDVLRHNTVEMLSECLHAPHITVGAWYEGQLAGFSVLYYPSDETEDLSIHLQGVDISGKKAANYKLCIVRPAFRGNRLQYLMALELERYAKENGVQLLCVTASPHNPYSIANLMRLGYTCNRTLSKYGFERNLYYKFL